MRTVLFSVIVVLIVCLSTASCGGDHSDGDGLSRGRPDEGVFESTTSSPVVTDAASTGGVSWVDFDGDGDVDLMVTNGYDVSAENPVPQKNRLYENRGGEFVDVSSGPVAEDDGFSSGSTWADFDNDGHIDVFIANQRGQDNFLYRNLGDGRFEKIADGPPATCAGNSYGASWVDVDNDGLVDLFVANGGLSHQNKNCFYRNIGDGRFSPVVEGSIIIEEGSTCGVSWADYDNDGDQDVFVSDLQQAQTGTGGLYRNDGDWVFVRQGSDVVPLGPSMPSAAAWGDMDNDGDLDLYLAGVYGMANILLSNNGVGGFDRVTVGDATIDGGHSYGANWADVDNDGDLDLAVANWGAGQMLYENDGTGRLDRMDGGDFGATIEYPATIAWADFDGDGFLDLALGNWPNAPGPGEINRLFRNRGAGGHWLIVVLEGTASNRSAIGARIEALVTIGGRPTTLIREVSAHTGWRSQNDLRQHLGLGDAETIDVLLVRWPSGATSRLTDVETDRVIEVVETG